ncbi:MAG TPA: hypothetical protein VGH21_08870, partial [Solirubrobacteraceae bacterium]
MRRVSQNIHSGTAGARRAVPAAVAATLAACLAALAAAAGAGAAEPINKEDFAPFADCPTATAAVCIVSNTTGGEFKLGNKTVPIEEGTVIKLQ